MANAKAGRNASDLSFCGCRGCRWGRRTNAGGFTIRARRRAARHVVAQRLDAMRQTPVDEIDDANHDLTSVVPVGFTD
jgi:hypothetical protein